MNLFLYDDQPIIACSTATTSHAAIAVIRLGGFSELHLFQDFFSLALSKVQPRHVYRSELRNQSGESLDDVLFTFFQAPHSYNGENILEISVHGNRLNVDRILQAFVASGKVRHALPGEFTYRALKNKKMTLSQVEGLDLLLNAQSSLSVNQGQALLHGRLYENYEKLHASFLQLKSSVELFIDFLEDVGDEGAQLYFDQALHQLVALVEQLYNRSQGELGSILSPEIILVGQTNAGKSSLFNALLKTHRAIVSPQAGTTRDYLSEFLYLQDTHFKLIDTAGLRLAQDQIEDEGIKRAMQMIDKAFFKVLVVNPFETDLTYLKEYRRYYFDLVVFTHADERGESYLQAFQEAKEALLESSIFPAYAYLVETSLEKNHLSSGGISGPIGPLVKNCQLGGDQNQSGPIGPDNVDLIGQDLVKACSTLIWQKYQVLTANDPILIQRHRDVIKALHHEVHSFQVLATAESDMGIISHQLRSIGQLVGELIGIITPEEVLSSIFSNFCIGK